MLPDGTQMLVHGELAHAQFIPQARTQLILAVGQSIRKHLEHGLLDSGQGLEGLGHV